MSKIQIKAETKNIYNEFGAKGKSSQLLCPIMRVLQMRHSDIDKKEARVIISDFLNS